MTFPLPCLYKLTKSIPILGYFPILNTSVTFVVYCIYIVFLHITIYLRLLLSQPGCPAITVTAYKSLLKRISHCTGYPDKHRIQPLSDSHDNNDNVNDLRMNINIESK